MTSPPAVSGFGLGLGSALSGVVRTVSVGHVGELSDGRRTIRSAFIKHPLEGPVALSLDGLPGDEHVYEHHGGPDMALLAYSHDHYDHWRSVHGLDLPEAGAWGENLTVDGLTETEVHLGDVFTLGTTVIQVCQPRAPCYKLAARYGVKQMAKLVQESGFTGYLFRVLQPGVLAAGDIMSLVEREDHGVTVAEAGRILNIARGDLDGARRVLAVPSLGFTVRNALAARVARGAVHGDDAERLYGN